jgi:hypothetical protein
MKPNYYQIIQDCIERGVDAGYNKAFKHSEIPDERTIKEELERYVMLEICNYFNFEDSI